MYTADHRAISACACVYRRLREVDRLLTEARDHVLEAAAALEDPDDACRAVELLRLAGQKRADAHEEARAGLRAMVRPAPLAEAVSDETVRAAPVRIWTASGDTPEDPEQEQIVPVLDVGDPPIVGAVSPLTAPGQRGASCARF